MSSYEGDTECIGGIAKLFAASQTFLPEMSEVWNRCAWTKMFALHRGRRGGGRLQNQSGGELGDCKMEAESGTDEAEAT